MTPAPASSRDRARMAWAVPSLALRDCYSRHVLGTAQRAASLAMALAWGVSATLVPTHAAALWSYDLQVKDGTAALLSVERAEQKRTSIRQSVASDRSAGRMSEVAEALERDGASLGDPILLLEAGEAWLAAAEESSSIEDARRAEMVTRTALDIVYFYRDVGSGKTRSRWTVVTTDQVPDLLERGDRQIEASAELIDRIENPPRSSDGAGRADADGQKKARAKAKKKKSRVRGERAPKRPGTGMIVGGSLATAVAGGGVALSVAGLLISSSRQKEVETLDAVEDAERVETLDKEGKQANLFAYVGLGVAVGALAVGLPLLIVGVKKRKASPVAASVRIVPDFGGTQQGVSVIGRF